MPRLAALALVINLTFSLLPKFLTIHAQEVEDLSPDPGEPGEGYVAPWYPMAGGGVIEGEMGSGEIIDGSGWGLDSLESGAFEGMESLSGEGLAGLTSYEPRTLFITDGLPRSIMQYSLEGDLSVFYHFDDLAINPEGLDVDPRNGDLISITYRQRGGLLTRIFADGSGSEIFTTPLGIENDLVVDNYGYTYAARFHNRDIVRISPNGSWNVVVPDAGAVEEMAFDPATNDVYWGAIGPNYMIGKIPGGWGCPCPRIRAPIPVTAMAFDREDEIPGYDLAIAHFYHDWVFLVDFQSEKFTITVMNNWMAPEDLAIRNGKIIFPDNWGGGIYEIDPIDKTMRMLISPTELRRPLGMALRAIPTPTVTPTPTPTPGKLLDVRIFRQYSDPWGDQEYDHGNSQSLWCGSTMEECGCATTSLAMILKYHGVIYDPYGNPTTPETVNNFFREGEKCSLLGCTSTGYAFGDVRWSAANQYSKEAHDAYDTPKVIYNGGDSSGGHDSKLYKEEIDDDKPIILAVPNHFIVATGYNEDTFTINDPYFDERTQLDDPAYDNSSLGYHLFKTTNTDYSSLEIVAPAPVQFVITDPIGQQTGFDPTTKQVKKEIPNSNYFFNAVIGNPLGGNTPPEEAGTYWAIIGTPQAGDYQIEIINSTGQPGSFAVYGADKDANLNYDLFKVISSEEPANQTITYNPDPGRPPLTLRVSIDIKPDSEINPINCESQNSIIPVAILSTDTFDATTIDDTTVSFAGAVEVHIDGNTGLPRRHEEDVNSDGKLDLMFHFRLGDTYLACQSTEAVLSGDTINSLQITGKGVVRMIGSKNDYLPD